MRKSIAIIIAIAVGVVSFFPKLTSADELPETPTNSQKVHITAISAENSSEFIQLYNESDEAIFTDDITLIYYANGITTTEITLPHLGKLASRGYLTIGQSLFLQKDISFKDIGITNASGDEKDLLAYGSVGLEVEINDSFNIYESDIMGDKVCWGAESANTQLSCEERQPTLAANQYLAHCDQINFFTKQCSTSTTYEIRGRSLFQNLNSGFVPKEPEDEDDPNENDTEESVMCSFLSLNEISFSDPEKFIEIKNTTATPINLDDCALRRGNSYIYMDGEIAPNEIKSFSVADSDLTQTNNGVNIYIYDLYQRKNVVTVAYKSRNATSYAWLEVDGIEGWYSTYIMTPGSENKYQSFPNCEVGYHLNIATNKCNKDPEPPAECAEGQFRNPETGRCKKLPEAKVLAECPDGQFRNPATNRCKKIATDDDLVPCAEGYERNPETNRCRKIKATDDAEYAVEPYGVSSENRTWVIVGVGAVVGLGLIVAFQFRHEIALGFKKIVRRKK